MPATMSNTVPVNMEVPRTVSATLPVTQTYSASQNFVHSAPSAQRALSPQQSFQYAAPAAQRASSPQQSFQYSAPAAQSALSPQQSFQYSATSMPQVTRSVSQNQSFTSSAPSVPAPAPVVTYTSPAPTTLEMPFVASQQVATSMPQVTRSVSQNQSFTTSAPSVPAPAPMVTHTSPAPTTLEMPVVASQQVATSMPQVTRSVSPSQSFSYSQPYVSAPAPVVTYTSPAPTTVETLVVVPQQVSSDASQIKELQALLEVERAERMRLEATLAQMKQVPKPVQQVPKPVQQAPVEPFPVPAPEVIFDPQVPVVASGVPVVASGVPTQLGKDEIEVNLDRSEARRCGMELEVRTNDLKVREINEGGLVDEWNNKNPKHKVFVGDFIVAVNDVSGPGTGDAMQDQLLLEQRCTLAVKKGPRAGEEHCGCMSHHHTTVSKATNIVKPATQGMGGYTYYQGETINATEVVNKSGLDMPDCFEVQLCKPEGQALGLGVQEGQDNETALKIVEVGGGVVDSWNASAVEKEKLRVKDNIVEVNGYTDVDNMKNELTQNTNLNMRIQRDHHVEAHECVIS